MISESCIDPLPNNTLPYKVSVQFESKHYQRGNVFSNKTIENVVKSTYLYKGPSNRVSKKKYFLPFRVSGTLKPVEYAGKNRFLKY